MSESKNNTDKNRSKLTLKLSDSAKSKTLTLNKKQNSPNITSKKGIQVTIKGRKKEPLLENTIKNNQQQLQEKLGVIAKNLDNSLEFNNYSTRDLISSTKEKNENIQEENLDEKTIDENKIEVEEISTEITDLNKDIKVENDYIVDDFDIRNKIKQSLEISKKEQEEREKILEERKEELRKKEQERIEKEKLAKSFKKHKKDKSYSRDQFDDSDFVKGKKTNPKNDKINNRRLTYIIDKGYDSDETRYRKKKVKQNKDQFLDNKEYKKIVKTVNLPELITISDLAERMSEKTGDVVKKLFTMGMVVTANQAIDSDTAEIIITEFGHIVNRVSASDVENVLDEDTTNFELKPRAPIVTIMGHVDHGKTSLLDAIRKTDIVSKEHGGITQHIGASRIKVKSGNYITFLDTPGHQAFTEMRSRGANVTDIVILVVAADDGVKEQTIEAINHAKAANVPIIVAVNKIDKPDADPKRVTNELLNHDIVSEEMGGDVMFIPVSAKNSINLDKLEEAILLQAEILELKAAYEGKSSGVVLESKVDPKRGVIATLLVQKGSLDEGDLIIVGTSYGKVRKMTDSNNQVIKNATPSVPVEVLGLDFAPNSGDKFIEVDSERQAREIIGYRSRKEKEMKDLKNSAKSISDIFNESNSKQKILNVIIKADVHGSVEAINASVNKISTDEVSVKVIHMATGGITDSDVNLAAASNALILGFNTRANLSTKELASNKDIEIRYYSIIYDLVDDIKAYLSGMLDPTKSEEYLGQAEIREVFKISGQGKVAGCFVTNGIIKRNARARLLRDNIVIHDGVLKTVKRFKEDVKEVKNGFECGLSFENYEDIKEGDAIECYDIVHKERTIL